MPTDRESVSRFYGLRPSSTVLESGCGGGTLTYLLSRKIKTGRIEAVDISPYAIAFARKNILQKNVQFHVQDIANFYSGQAFYYITLFDVLEHIPISDQKRMANVALPIPDPNVPQNANLSGWIFGEYGSKPRANSGITEPGGGILRDGGPIVL